MFSTQQVRTSQTRNSASSTQSTSTHETRSTSLSTGQTNNINIANTIEARSHTFLIALPIILFIFFFTKQESTNI